MWCAIIYFYIIYIYNIWFWIFLWVPQVQSLSGCPSQGLNLLLCVTGLQTIYIEICTLKYFCYLQSMLDQSGRQRQCFEIETHYVQRYCWTISLCNACYGISCAFCRKGAPYFHIFSISVPHSTLSFWRWFFWLKPWCFGVAMAAA